MKEYIYFMLNDKQCRAGKDGKIEELVMNKYVFMGYFHGVSIYHWQKKITISFTEIWMNPMYANGNYLWINTTGKPEIAGGRYGINPVVRQCRKIRESASLTYK